MDRIQIIKGWIDAEGSAQEKIFNVAWSGQDRLNSKGDLMPVGNSVNIKTASYTNTIGSPTLSVFWQDPEFNINQPAFYYARVLQIPTPRHSLYDAWLSEWNVLMGSQILFKNELIHHLSGINLQAYDLHHARKMSYVVMIPSDPAVQGWTFRYRFGWQIFFALAELSPLV